MKVEVAKDVLYYLAMTALPDGGERANQNGTRMMERVATAARRIKAAAIAGPVEIVVT